MDKVKALRNSISRTNVLSKSDTISKSSFRSIHILSSKRDEIPEIRKDSNKFTLKYISPDVEKKFISYYLEDSYTKAKFSLTLVFVMELLCSFYEFVYLNTQTVVLGSKSWPFVTLRYFVAAIFLGLQGFSLTSLFNTPWRYWVVSIGTFVALIANVAQFVIAFDITGTTTWSYTFMAHSILILIYLYSFSALPLLYCSAVSGAFCALSILTLAFNMHWMTSVTVTAFLFATSGVLGFIGYNTEKFIRERFLMIGEIEIERHKIENQKQLSNSLLLNIFPKVIIEKFKRDKATIVEEFTDCTIFFSDVVSFTELSSTKTPYQLVTLLYDLFTRFDVIVAKYKLEKIKTIGDAYMAVGGVPIPTPDHAECVANMALEVLEAVKDFNKKNAQLLQGKEWNIRIGLHTGSIVGGVIGKKKYLYDLYGETVSTANAMEQYGAPGRIHLSESTYEHLKRDFTLEEAKEVVLKTTNRTVKTYFLTGKKNQDQQDPHFVAPEPATLEHSNTRMPVVGAALSLSIANPIWKHLNQEIDGLANIKLATTTLAFPLIEIEKEFHKYYFTKNLQTLRVSALIVIAFIFLLELFDPTLRTVTTESTVIRCLRYAGIVPLCAFLIGFTFFPPFEKYMQFTIALMMFVFYTTWMVTGTLFQPANFAGLAFGHIISFFMIKLRFKYAAIISTVFQVAFIITAAVIGFLDLLGVFLLVLGVYGYGLIVSYILERYLRMTFVNRKLLNTEQERLKIETAKSDELLYNLLPFDIAQFLKENPDHNSVIATSYPNVTIMFVNVAGLSGLEEKMELKELFKLVNTIFCKFDDITELHKIEKIKTIGSSYMVANGLADIVERSKLKDVVKRIISTANDMLQYIEDFNADNRQKSRKNIMEPIELHLTIGIHIGRVVAGVIGRKKFAYDVWGDVVNVASRMQTTSTPNNIQVTEKIYNLMKDNYQFTERGEIDIKGKGKMKTYFLHLTPRETRSIAKLDE